MCTVTWQYNDTGYDVFMTRDELYSRGHALPPSVTTEKGASFVAPRDSDAGGTWIAASETGLTVCLLNHYPVESGPAPAAPRSRGHIVTDAIRAGGVVEIDAMLAGFDLSRFRPFTLLVFQPDTQPLMRQWDGTHLRSANEIHAPITSSSFDSERVVASRVATYERLVGEYPTVETLLAYHRSHQPERGPASVCVHREDGGSRAFSHITVSTDCVRFFYHDGSPCEPTGEVTVELERAS